MRDFEERIVSELDDLEQKRSALSDFMYGDVFPTLSDVDQVLLMMQFRAMASYAALLSDRIERFKEHV
jgi:hypothetical protein